MHNNPNLDLVNAYAKFDHIPVMSQTLQGF